MIKINNLFNFFKLKFIIFKNLVFIIVKSMNQSKEKQIESGKKAQKNGVKFEELIEICW